MLGIFPVGDLTKVVEVDARADAVILEEPEHCALPSERVLYAALSPAAACFQASMHLTYVCVDLQ